MRYLPSIVLGVFLTSCYFLEGESRDEVAVNADPNSVRVNDTFDVTVSYRFDEAAEGEFEIIVYGAGPNNGFLNDIENQDIEDFPLPEQVALPDVPGATRRFPADVNGRRVGGTLTLVAVSPGEAYFLAGIYRADGFILPQGGTTVRITGP